MANIVGDIAIKIGADIGPLVTNLDRAQGKVSAFGAAASGAAGGGMKAWNLAAAAMAGAAVTAGLGLAALTKHAIDLGGAMHDASVKTGVHVAALQAMTQVAGEAGVSSDALISSLSKMSNTIAGLQSGSKAQVEAFRALGVSMNDLTGLAPDQQFAVIAKAIDDIKDPALQTAAAMDVFGKSGADLIPMMDGYAVALAEVAQKQRDLGIAMSDEQAAKMDEAGDAMGRITMAAQGLGTQLAITFGPATLYAIEKMTTAIEGWAIIFEKAADLATTSNVEALAASIGDMSETVAMQLDDMAGSLNNMQFVASAEKMRMLTASFQAGGMTAVEYTDRLETARAAIIKLITKAGEANGLPMDDSIANMNAYIDALSQAVGLQSQLAFAGTAEAGAGGGAGAGASGSGTVSFGGSSGGGRGGGGGGGGNPLQDKLDALEKSLQSEAEAEAASYAERQQILDDALAAKLISLEQYQTDAEALQADHQDRMADIDGAAYSDGTSQIAGYLGTMADVFQSGNEKIAKIGREFAAAEALVNAWRAASQALADPTVPFYGKFAAAASVLAAGLGMVASIKSGSTSSGGGGSSSGGSSGGSTGGTSSGSTTAPLQVMLSGIDPSQLYSGSQISGILDALTKEAGDRGYTIMVPA